ncbi:hypothetical protein [Endozoicomonas sp. Mp262]|uniref:hypothetical protein n=1 Tax=Endozoicomonas sp. Mp262 TaxID=2919499 RepID=UPI0021D99DBD
MNTDHDPFIAEFKDAMRLHHNKFAETYRTQLNQLDDYDDDGRRELLIDILGNLPGYLDEPKGKLKDSLYVCTYLSLLAWTVAIRQKIPSPDELFNKMIELHKN